MDRHRIYFRAAFEIAQESPDPSTQTGAVVVDNSTGALLGRGCNEFPRGVRHTEERLQRPMKYNFIEHAERNAIFDVMKKYDFYQRGAEPVMYALWAACADCARAIIQAGIKKVYTHSFYNSTGHDWGGSIQAGFDMLEEAGIPVAFIDPKVMQGDESLLFNGERIKF